MPLCAHSTKDCRELPRLNHSRSQIDRRLEAGADRAFARSRLARLALATALSAIEHQTPCPPAAPQTLGSGSVLRLLCCHAAGLRPGFESCPLTMTVHFHDRGINHGVLHIRLAADGIKAFLPDTGLDPVAKALEDGVAFAEFFRPIAPEAACAHVPQRSLCEPSACPCLLALHRQACPGSAGPSAPTACRSILFFPWRDCCTRGRFSTGPSVWPRSVHAMSPEWARHCQRMRKTECRRTKARSHFCSSINSTMSW